MHYIIEASDPDWNKSGYVALDADSGGYPYVTEHLNVAKIWTSKEEVLRYCSSFEERAKRQNWCLYEFELKRTLCLMHNGEFTEG